MNDGVRRRVGEPMRVSMTLPTMAGGNDREQTLAWCRRIDEGPFHSLAVGERIAYPNPELMTTLAFAAAVTERVRIVPTIVVLPMHPELLMAKALATLDVLSGGRVTVGVGVGGREEDFAAAGGAPFDGRHARLDRQVATMRSVWAGQVPEGMHAPIGPVPVGGMPMLSGSLGPRAMARASAWGVGVVGFALDPNTCDWSATVAAVRDAWGHDTPPHVASTFWYSQADDGGDALRGYARNYLEVFGPAAADAMASMTTAWSLAATLEALDAAEEAGVDEIFLVPTSTSLGDLDALSSSIAARE